MLCPSCLLSEMKKNGHSKVSHKQQYCCNSCNKFFLENPINNRIPEEKKVLIKKALLERVSLAGIIRIFGVSKSWLSKFIKNLYTDIPEDLNCFLPSDGNENNDFEIITEADEMWSFVQNKVNTYWIWLIIDRESRQVIAYHVGGRTAKDAKQLWDNIPKQIQSRIGKIFTDYLQSYNTKDIPQDKHIAAGKDSGNTNHIERLNGTIRQRVSRLVRKSLSFSKKLSNHIGAIGYFLSNYNKELQQLHPS